MRLTVQMVWARRCCCWLLFSLFWYAFWRARHGSPGARLDWCAGAGLLVWSTALAERGRPLAAAALFAALVNMKHLFAAAGPVFAVHLLRSHCRHGPPHPLSIDRHAVLSQSEQGQMGE